MITRLTLRLQPSMNHRSVTPTFQAARAPVGKPVLLPGSSRALRRSARDRRIAKNRSGTGRRRFISPRHVQSWESKRANRSLKVLPRVKLLTSVLLLVVYSALAQSSERLSALKTTVESAFASLQTPGLSVAVGVSNRLFWSTGFGFADLEQRTAANPGTIYRYASISKPIAATAAMQLVEAGRVSLDAPIQRYVPSFPSKAEGEIALRHLLTHTSGIRHYQGMEMLSNKRYSSVAEALGIFKEDPLKFPPGTKYLYSSYGYNIVAALVEEAAGKSFRLYLREKIFRPAGMATADLEFLEEPVKNRSRQYVRQDGRFVPAPEVDLSCKWAGGGMAGNAEDLVWFCMALNDGRLLGTEARQVMYESAVLPDGSRTEYGLGWRTQMDSHKRLWVGHSGGATGGTTHFLHNPENNVAVALLANAQAVKGLGDLALRLGQIVLPAGEAPPATGSQ